MSVDHVIPQAVVEELDNVLANLKLMPSRVNREKSAKLEDRQKEFARRFVAAGIITAEAVPWAGPFDGKIQASPVTKKAPAASAPVSVAFVGSSRSAVFHKSTCASVAKLAPKNVVHYGSRDEAVQAGKQLCADGNP